MIGMLILTATRLKFCCSTSAHWWQGWNFVQWLPKFQMVKLTTAICDTCGVDGWYSGRGKVTTRSESFLQYEQSFKLGYRWQYIFCIPLKHIKSLKNILTQENHLGIASTDPLPFQVYLTWLVLLNSSPPPLKRGAAFFTIHHNSKLQVSV